MPRTTDATSFLPLKPNDFHILFTLADGPLHGYAIAKDILARTDDQLRLEAGNLHRTLRKLVRQGLVVPSNDRPDPEDDDARRHYWSVTELGRQVLALEARRMRALVNEAEARKLITREATR